MPWYSAEWYWLNGRAFENLFGKSACGVTLDQWWHKWWWRLKCLNLANGDENVKRPSEFLMKRGLSLKSFCCERTRNEFIIKALDFRFLLIHWFYKFLISRISRSNKIDLWRFTLLVLSVSSTNDHKMWAPNLKMLSELWNSKSTFEMLSEGWVNIFRRVSSGKGKQKKHLNKMEFINAFDIVICNLCNNYLILVFRYGKTLSLSRSLFRAISKKAWITNDPRRALLAPEVTEIASKWKESSN